MLLSSGWLAVAAAAPAAAAAPGLTLPSVVVAAVVAGATVTVTGAGAGLVTVVEAVTVSAGAVTVSVGAVTVMDGGLDVVVTVTVCAGGAGVVSVTVRGGATTVVVASSVAAAAVRATVGAAAAPYTWAVFPPQAASARPPAASSTTSASRTKKVAHRVTVRRSSRPSVVPTGRNPEYHPVVQSPGVTIVPANAGELGGSPGRLRHARKRCRICQCQRYKLRPREAFRKFPVEERARRLREQTECGHPESATTSGLVAYLDDEPVGWCAVEPRTHYEGLLRNIRVPWEGRTEDKADDSVWAVTCIFARAGFRRRGVGYALVQAAVDFARGRGARALEGYPMLTDGQDITWGELNVGTPSMFAAAGLTEVSRPTKRRVVMRIDF